MISKAPVESIDLYGDLDDLRGRGLNFSPALGLVFLLWFFFLIEPHWFIGIGPLKKIPLLLFPAVLAIGLFYAPRNIWHWAFLGFVAVHFLHLPFVPNIGLARKSAEAILYLYAMLLASVAILDTVKRLAPVLTLYLIHYFWYAIQGIPTGGVAWHSIMENPDSFGPLMVMGIGFAYYWAMGSEKTSMRWFARIVSILCVIGVVSSIARGAVMSAGLVMFAIWWKSPRKLISAIGGIVLIVTVIIASSIMFPGGGFWAEMQTVTEGTDKGTSGDRWVLWQAGWTVFTRNPILGVGAENCGIWASENFSYGDAGGDYTNPGRLWGRSLHNVYVQLICEQGIVGTFFFFMMLVDFLRRTRRMKRPECVEIWARIAPNLPQLRELATGMQLAMLGFLATNLFYGQLYPHWFYSLVIFAVCIDRIVQKGVRRVRANRNKLRGELEEAGVVGAP